MVRPLPAVVTALAVAAVLAGCASSNDDTAATVTETVTVTRAIPEQPVPPGGDDGVPDTVAGGAGGDDGVPEADDAPAAPAPWEPGGARAAVRALSAKIGYTPEFVSIGLYDSYAVFRVRDRAKPRNVDAYYWRDSVIGDSQPVRVDGDRVGEYAFRLRDFDLDAVPRLVARARRVDLEDGEVGGVLIERGFGASNDVRFLVNISGSRESAQLRADAQGRVTQILR